LLTSEVCTTVALFSATARIRILLGFISLLTSPQYAHTMCSMNLLKSLGDQFRTTFIGEDICNQWDSFLSFHCCLMLKHSLGLDAQFSIPVMRIPPRSSGA
jgi:hypothetical protein